MSEEKKRPRTAAQIIRQIVERRHPNMGCMDGSCIFGHPGGMQTNGGCQCMKERDYPMPQRNIMVLRDVAMVLAAMVVEEKLEAAE